MKSVEVSSGPFTVIIRLYPFAGDKSKRVFERMSAMVYVFAQRVAAGKGDWPMGKDGWTIGWDADISWDMRPEHMTLKEQALCVKAMQSAILSAGALKLKLSRQAETLGRALKAGEVRTIVKEEVAELEATLKADAERG